jgi:hypothetical protein
MFTLTEIQRLKTNLIIAYRVLDGSQNKTESTIAEQGVKNAQQNLQRYYGEDKLAYINCMLECRNEAREKSTV